LSIVQGDRIPAKSCDRPSTLHLSTKQEGFLIMTRPFPKAQSYAEGIAALHELYGKRLQRLDRDLKQFVVAAVMVQQALDTSMAEVLEILDPDADVENNDPELTEALLVLGDDSKYDQLKLARDTIAQLLQE
jgi:hypothetical protein